MNVPREFHGVRLIFHENGLEPALEQRPAPPPAAVEPAGVARVQVVHSGGEVRPRGAQIEMMVVAHQGPGEDPPPAARGHAVEQFALHAPQARCGSSMIGLSIHSGETLASI